MMATVKDRLKVPGAQVHRFGKDLGFSGTGREVADLLDNLSDTFRKIARSEAIGLDDSIAFLMIDPETTEVTLTLIPRGGGPDAER